MTTERAVSLLTLLLVAGSAPTWLCGRAVRVAPSGRGALRWQFKAKSVRVYVSVFDIDAKPATEPASIPEASTAQKPQSDSRPPEVSAPKPKAASPGVKESDRLKSFFSDALLQALRKSGFTAAAQLAGRPEKGISLSGVFVDVDSQNHNCLAVLGSKTQSTGFLLYVGAFNLARPDQPLYRVMTMETCDAQHGPLISLNNYIPMEKYEISKNPTEEEVRKICGQIVANLTALLTANPAAFSD